jgi:Sigma-70, region 4
MSSLDSLPQDQRAVLQLVLSRRRSYDQIAQLLKINPSSVRERAHAALTTLGPETDVSEENRGRIADYLLGQLSEPSEVDEVRSLLAHSPGERAWARVVASELAPLAGGGLPEIPTEAGAPQPAASAPAAADAGQPAGSDGEPADRRRRSSRLGGIIVLAIAVIVIAGVLVFVLTKGNSSSPKHQAAASASTTASTPAASATSTTSSGSSTTPAKVVAQINLTPPHAGSKAVGIAEVLDEGASQGVAIVAQNVPPNTKKPPNAYAVWLYNSPTDAKILGFVNPGVGSNGRLSTAGALPSDAKHYKDLIVTVETNAKPKTPGTIILQGTLTGL